MKLTPEQIEAVRGWAAAGASLNDIQRKLKSELGVGCTYMDLRLALLDLGISLLDKPRTPDPVPVPAPQPAPATETGSWGDESDVTDTGGGSVSVTLDELTIPGTMASGKATFSDGKTISWYVDQMGRLGMKAPEPGYQPPPADIPDFQNQLDRVLMQAGM
jgi:hypothetical protein